MPVVPVSGSRFERLVPAVVTSGMAREPLEFPHERFPIAPLDDEQTARRRSQGKPSFI